MTREAFDVYGRALAPDGVLLVHVTNRFLDLEPVVAAIANQQGWTARARRIGPPGKQPAGHFDTRSHWIILTRTPERMATVLAATSAGPKAWQSLRERPDMALWTDDFSSILPILGSY
jgi:hypothetical protein